MQHEQSVKKILTPKEKQTLDKQIVTKKKKFFRILLSNPECLTFCSSVIEEKDDFFKQEFETKFNDIVQKETETKLNRLKEENEKITIEMKDESKMTIKKKKPNQTVKFDEITFGLNETFKMIERNQLSLILIERSLAMNLKNVLRKLCNENGICCLDMNLSNCQQILKISSLAVMSFRKLVTEPQSKFNDLYNLVVQNFFPEIKTKIPEIETSVQQEPIMEQIQEPEISLPTIEQESDSKEEILPQIIMEKNKTTNIIKNEFIDNDSFVPLISYDNEEYFLNHKPPSERFQFSLEIIWSNDGNVRQEKPQISLQFSPQLFKLNKLTNVVHGPKKTQKTNSSTSQQQQYGNLVKFYSPKLLKGQCDPNLETVSKRSKRKNKKKKIQK